MTPLQYYTQQLDDGFIQKDSQQLEVIYALQTIYEKLIYQQQHREKIISYVTKFFLKPQAVNGLYVWGSVGVGKTFLMDCFYICYPYKKIRLHFHRFIQRVHAELRDMQGESDPLKKIAKKISLETTVICFDEFFVSNIADAMILGELFKALFSEGVCLITTSNVAPDDLYKNGLQRERFLPAIESIKKNTQVFHMISHHDYRLTHLEQAGVYFSPLNPQNAKYFEKTFFHLSENKPLLDGDIELFGRAVKTHMRTETQIWFEFKDICGVPRSQNDYIELAKQYHTVFVSDVPILQASQLNLTTAFINLIDVFYDAGVRIVISAAAGIEALYPQGQLRFEFARTQSRLIEMQSDDYFKK